MNIYNDSLCFLHNIYCTLFYFVKAKHSCNVKCYSPKMSLLAEYVAKIILLKVSAPSNIYYVS